MPALACHYHQVVRGGQGAGLMSCWYIDKTCHEYICLADTCCQPPRLPASTLSCVILIQALFYTVKMHLNRYLFFKSIADFSKRTKIHLSGWDWNLSARLMETAHTFSISFSQSELLLTITSSSH